MRRIQKAARSNSVFRILRQFATPVVPIRRGRYSISTSTVLNPASLASTRISAVMNTPEPVRMKLRDLRETQSAARFEMGLIGMAASILIICGAWLMNVAPASDDQLASVTLDSVMSHSRSADIRDPLLQELVKEYARE